MGLLERRDFLFFTMISLGVAQRFVHGSRRGMFS
jgi:hypothetical protein